MRISKSAKSLGLSGLICISYATCGCDETKPSETVHASPKDNDTGANPTDRLIPDHSSEVKLVLERGILSVAESNEAFKDWFDLLMMPQYEDWCKRTFGNELGSRLSIDFNRSILDSKKLFRDNVDLFRRMGATDVRVVRVSSEVDFQTMVEERRALELMKEHVPLYSARFYKPGDSKPSFSWGGFVYVDGHVRWIGNLNSLE